MANGRESTLDHRGARRLSTRETVFWYVLAAVTYIGVGMYQRWLLTWFLGPAWLIAFVVFGPMLTDPFRRR